MIGKIALEEHFALPETLADSTRYASGHSWSLLEQRSLDLHDHRVSVMDGHGIAYAILSLNSPAIQAVADRSRAIEIARRANDVLAEAVARKPDRLGGFAALPLQDPDAAGEELTRAVTELGFKGALANGFSQVGSGDDVVYYDHLPRFGGASKSSTYGSTIGRHGQSLLRRRRASPGAGRPDDRRPGQCVGSRTTQPRRVANRPEGG